MRLGPPLLPLSDGNRRRTTARAESAADRLDTHHAARRTLNLRVEEVHAHGTRSERNRQRLEVELQEILKSTVSRTIPVDKVSIDGASTDRQSSRGGGKDDWALRLGDALARVLRARRDVKGDES